MKTIGIDRLIIMQSTAMIIIAMGMVEAVTGWLQLLGVTGSNHDVYPVTGTFYNPGPMCGFLAMILPVALYVTLRPGWRVLAWAGCVYMLASVTLIPVLMGRTGWIAGAAGCVLVLAGSGRLPRVKLKAWSTGVIVVTGCFIVALSLFYLKPESAMGRLLIWRDGVSAIADNPLSGVGWDRVAGALGTAQEEYFASHPDGGAFAGVAGSPEYAFNEFLQIGIAYGVPVMVAFVLLLGFALRCAIKGREYGFAGSLIAFAIVGMASYPFQFPEFIGIVAVVIIVSIGSWRAVTKVMWTLSSLPVAVIAVAACITLNSRASMNEKWNRTKPVYGATISDPAHKRLDSLMTTMEWNSRFLFDYGKLLRYNGELELSSQVLGKGVERSSDPMFLNLLGRNSHDLGQYDLAENYLHRSINRLPGRLYPYYLLCRLYADSANYHPDRFRQVYDRAMALRIKVKSPAINQMKHELRHLNDSLRSSGTLQPTPQDEALQERHLHRR
ncbi:MAG: O-antigen ligase family protein [Clostridiales bacterium]|nr:O-antigen ligase family protein [Clostridiales bacterium]